MTLCQTLVIVEGRFRTVYLSPHDWCSRLPASHECSQLDYLLELVHGLRRPCYRQQVITVVRWGPAQGVFSSLLCARRWRPYDINEMLPATDELFYCTELNHPKGETILCISIPMSDFKIGSRAIV